jgi:hypothetical protein
MENGKLSGYSAFTSYEKVEKEVQSYFLEATKSYLGVGFTPIAVAHQLVNGTNFAYFTIAKGVYPDAKAYNALVIVHVATNGTVALAEVKPVRSVRGSGEGLLGGYTVFRPAFGSDNLIPEIFRKKAGIGVGYTALAIASQVVAGINYAIFAEAQIPSLEAAPYNVIATLFHDLEGEFHLTHIERVQIL